MKKMRIVHANWPLTPRDPSVPAWKDVTDKDWHVRRMAVYAAQIDRMDQGIGRMMAALKASGAEQDTLIFFLADNGGCAEDLRPNPKPLPIYMPARTRDGRPLRAGNDSSIKPGGDDTYQSYGIGWANASNTPFRLYKHWVHEGGISTPLIVRWPHGIKHRNTLTPQPGHLIDIMATCVDVAGAKYPATFKGERITPMEGRSLRPIFAGQKREAHPGIYWEHEGNRAVRQGKYKVVSRFPDKWELYDLDADRSEMDDIAGSQPDLVRKMTADYDAWAKRANVQPWSVVRTKIPGAGGTKR
jgi:arylsulfatase A-like enzyme